MLYQHIDGLNNDKESLKKDNDQKNQQIATLQKDILGLIRNQRSKLFYFFF